MKNNKISSGRLLICVIAIAGWFALACQLYLTLTNNHLPVTEIIIRYFSYFTVLTNILVAAYATAMLFPKKGRFTALFTSQSAAAAIAIYITVVGIIYNTILRFTWEPKGMQRVADELLHLIIPLFFIIYWLFKVKHDQLRWKHIWRWLLYPLGYLVFVLFRGAPSGFYPYPFLDVNALGYQKVFINSLGVTLVFVVLSCLVVFFGRRRS